MTKTNGEVMRRADVDASNPHGSDAVTVAGSMHQVNIGLDGEVWAVGTDGNVYHRADVSDYSPAGSGWSLKEGT